VNRAWIAAAAALVALSAALSLLPGGRAAASEPVQLNRLGLPARAFGAALVTGVGALDPTFGAGGKVRTDLGGQIEWIEDLAVQSDGKIVAVGTTGTQTTSSEFALARYASDGSLDASFGAGGKVTTDFGGRAFAVALRGDGKIVVAGDGARGGATGDDIALARFNTDGSLDTSFGVGGKVLTDFNSTNEAASELAIQPDGRLVVVGYTGPFGPYVTNPPDFALARYNPNGSLDTSFDGDGKVSTAFTAGWSDQGYGIALAPDGKIVAAGWGIPAGASGPGVIDVARYNADGSLDASFGGDGTLVSAPGSNNGAFAVVVQPDGRVVVAGFVGSDLALVRYTVRGSLDSTFGIGGVARADYGTQQALAWDLARQPDGKLVAAGSTLPKTDAEANAEAFAVARFESSGKPDKSFSGGAISTDFGAWDLALAVALQADGKIVAGGVAGQSDPERGVTADFALARYLGGPPACKVPNVRGKKLALARPAITKAHCRVGKVRRKASKNVQRGRVISQSPKAGKRLPNRSKVNLVVSRGHR